ncbi:YcxB family protein [Aquibacillus rhizosphaerae]|uniref:YcxB family protein n=1 Tax=Aquibacillus rhizosphaerae TaxID=3051431 RepID=A0ABT7LA48_9BACI|nr:YcxB family protein [Aquibacillus sp. LR5S19]MDL4842269.1 YcxB family protein [Aquibacillus sp. LR5S19]
MEINYTLTKDDYINFNLYHAKHSKSIQKTLFYLRVTAPILYLGLAAVFSFITEIPILVTLVPFIVISILWVVFYPRLFYGTIKRNAYKMIKESENDSLLGKHQMKVDEAGIIDKTTNGQTSVNWSGVVNFAEEKDYYFIYIGSINAYIIPKRYLPGQSLKQFDETVKLHIPS